MEKSETKEEKEEEEEEGGTVVCKDEHALNSSWVLWFDAPREGKRKQGASSFSSGLRRVGSFETVEQFWGVMNNVVSVAKLPQGSNCYLFRAGVEPRWEDPANAGGGKWVFTQRKALTQNSWISTCVAAISETLESETVDVDQVCGVVVSIRKSSDRLAVWLRSSNVSNESAVLEVGAKWKAILKGSGRIGFQIHGDAMKGSNSSFGSRNAVLTL